MIPSDSTQPTLDTKAATPRTDAADNFTTMTGHLVTCIRGGEYVLTDFARQLERDLTAARAEVERLKRDNGNLTVKLAQVEADRDREAAKVDRLTADNDALRAWKESALAVEREWDCQAVGTLLNMRLGTSIRAGIEPAVRALLADNAKLKEENERLEKYIRSL